MAWVFFQVSIYLDICLLLRPCDCVIINEKSLFPSGQLLAARVQWHVDYNFTKVQPCKRTIKKKKKNQLAKPTHSTHCNLNTQKVKKAGWSEFQGQPLLWVWGETMPKRNKRIKLKVIENTGSYCLDSAYRCTLTTHTYKNKQLTDLGRNQKLFGCFILSSSVAMCICTLYMWLSLDIVCMIPTWLISERSPKLKVSN